MAEVKYAVLGSGSSANAYIFEQDNFGFLIDNGFTLKEIIKRADDFHFTMGKLKFILLTHTHQDHSRGVGGLSRKLKIPIVVHQRLSRKKVRKIDPYKRLDVVPGKVYTFDSLTFVPFETSHDAEASLGFYFTFGGKRFTLLTDTGIIPDTVISYVLQSDVLFLEANYDEVMLREGTYPEYLKRRIASDKGHLSNKTALDFLEGIGDGVGPETVYLCHLSDSNNSPDLLAQMIETRYTKGKRNIRICNKGEALEGTHEYN